MSTISTRPDVLTYVAAVREHLSDLGAEVVEELTGGLEADLADLAAESDDPLPQRLGDPQGYAAELRTAAGLPGRVPTSRRAPIAARLRSHPQWPAVSGFFVTLRPAWWVARALTAWWLLTWVLGTFIGLLSLVVLVVAVVVSVELGRGRWERHGWLRAPVLVGNVLAALVLPIVCLTVVDGHRYVDAGSSSYVPPAGLTSNGTSVSNVFAYDGNGAPLTDVQLFDQDGRPLSVDPEQGAGSTDDGLTQLAGRQSVYGQTLYNVFPLRRERQVVDAQTGQQSTQAPTPVPPPLVAVPPVATQVPTVSGGVTPTATATPSAASTATTSPPSSPSPTGTRAR